MRGATSPTPDIMISIVINAVILGSIYALVALGLTIIFGVGNTLNLAHGAILTCGAFAAYVTANQNYLGLSPYLALISAIGAGAIVGAAIYLGIVRHIEGDYIVVLITTLAIGFMIQNFLRLFVAEGVITIPSILPGTLEPFGVPIRTFKIFVFAISCVCILFVYGLIEYTDIGKAMVSVSMSERGAQLVGIDIDRINSITWVLASGFAGLAGALLMMLQSGSWQMGLDPLIISFAIVILGGLGSIKGSIIGAYIIGFTETITISLIDISLQGLSAFILLIAILVVRPTGLFGNQQ
jgi:branched-chain amino acid transport system permease protein